MFPTLQRTDHRPDADMEKAALLTLARQYFIYEDGLSPVQIIRKIQVIEGGLDCFATPRAWSCPQFECRWRKECLRECVISETDEA